MREKRESRRYLTTTQAARLAHLSPSTLLRAIQSKKLKDFSTPGGHFRVDPASLQTFMELSGADALVKKRVLVVALSSQERSRLIREMKDDAAFSVAEADSLAEAMGKEASAPRAILLVPGGGTKRRPGEMFSPLADLRRLLN